MNCPVHPVHGPLPLAKGGMVGVTKIGARNVGYWINAVAKGEEDYYTKPGEAPGVWMGALAAELGLEGELGSEEYAAIFAGQNPRTGEPLLARPKRRTYVDELGRELKKEPVLGFDVRFSAPKSVSLVWAIGEPEVREAVLRAHEHAVAEGLAYLERNACFVQRGEGGRRIEPGAGFVAMAFLHRSSRAGDPALHTHLLVSNLTRARSDGKWLSLAAPKGRMPLWLHAKAAGHVYQAALRAQVTRELGLEWGEVANGHADLLAISREAIEHFSQRRAEIVERMAELGLESAAAAEVVAYRTRAGKDYGVSVDAQRADWIARGEELGLTPRSIAQIVRAARAREPRPLASPDAEEALADLEAHHSHFDRRELICAVAIRLGEGTDGLALERAADELIDSGRVVAVHRASEPMALSYYTTPRLWAMEREIVGAAVKGAGAGASQIDAAALAAVLERHRYLSAEQVEMVRRLTTGGERIVAVAALPGTGKTTALKAAAEGWAAAGFRGIGVSTSRSATNEIRGVGIPATSIAKLLILTSERAERGLEPLPRGAVIVVDEGSALETPHAYALLGLIEACEGKLVLIGDPPQIGAVGPGGIYGHLTRRLDPVVLTEIRRQRDPLDREIVRLAHEGRGSDALDVLDAEERLRIADTLEEAIGALALDWHRRFAEGQDAVMIARRNEDVSRLNEAAREIRRERGELGAGIEVAGTDYNVGDRVMTRLNTAEVSNRERWEIAGVDRARQTIALRRLGDAREGAILEAGYLQGRTPDGQPPLQHAYALTTYAAQGKTFEQAFVLLDPGVSREDFLVAVSRSRGSTTAYGVAAKELSDTQLGPPPEPREHLGDLREGAERVASEYAAVEVGLRKRIEVLDKVELAGRRAGLERRIAKAGERSPAAERLAGLEERIAVARSRLDALGAERRQPSVDPAERERIATLERQGASQLARFEEERARLAAKVAEEPDRAAELPALRYELRLVEERMTRLRRMEVEADRLAPSRPVREALGPRPDDPHKALAWDEGADLIHGFRLRYGIASIEGEPLGPRSGDARRRRERQAAQQRLERIQQSLEHERVQVVERSLELLP